jgi:hypothetical protein
LFVCQPITVPATEGRRRRPKAFQLGDADVSVALALTGPVGEITLVEVRMNALPP